MRDMRNYFLDGSAIGRTERITAAKDSLIKKLPGIAIDKAERSPSQEIYTQIKPYQLQRFNNIHVYPNLRVFLISATYGHYSLIISQSGAYILSINCIYRSQQLTGTLAREIT